MLKQQIDLQVRRAHRRKTLPCPAARPPRLESLLSGVQITEGSGNKGVFGGWMGRGDGGRGTGRINGGDVGQRLRLSAVQKFLTLPSSATRFKVNGPAA